MAVPKNIVNYSGAKSTTSLDVDAEALSNGTHNFDTGGDRLRVFFEDDNIAAGSGIASSEINLGAGANKLQVEYAGSADITESKGLDTVTLTAGAGADALSVSGLETGLEGSTVNLGDGNNSVWINAAATALKSSSLELGKNDDQVSLRGSVNNSVINLGDGANKLVLFDDVAGSQIYGGSGVDAIRLRGDVASTKINLGAGKDVLNIAKGVSDGTVISSSAGANTIYLGDKGLATNSKIVSADGSVVTLAQVTGNSTVNLGYNGDEPGLGNNKLTTGNVNLSFINTGNGNDTISVGKLDKSQIISAGGSNVITVSGGMTSAEGASAVIVTGAGNDNITVRGAIGGVAGEAVITTGAGQNTINLLAGTENTISSLKITGGSDKDNISIEAGKITALNLDSGDGNDNITIRGDMNASTISVGDGQNTVSISEANSVSFTAGNGADHLKLGLGQNVQVNLGEGNDTLHLTRVWGGGPRNTLVGGNGTDVIQYSDVDHTYTTLARLFSNTVVQGFEALDLSQTDKGMLLIRAEDMANVFMSNANEMGTFSLKDVTTKVDGLDSTTLKSALDAGAMKINGTLNHTLAFEQGWTQVGATSNSYKVFSKLDGEGNWDASQPLLLVQNAVKILHVGGSAPADKNVPADLSAYIADAECVVDMSRELAAYEGDPANLLASLSVTGAYRMEADGSNHWLWKDDTAPEPFADVTFDTGTLSFTFTLLQGAAWPAAMPRLTYQFAGDNDFETQAHDLALHSGGSSDLSNNKTAVTLAASFDETQFAFAGRASGTLTGSAGNDRIEIADNIFMDREKPKTWDLKTGADTLTAHNINAISYGDMSATLFTLNGTGENLIHASGADNNGTWEGGHIGNSNITLTGTGSNVLHAAGNIVSSALNLKASGDQVIRAGFKVDPVDGFDADSFEISDFGADIAKGGRLDKTNITTGAGNDEVHVAYAGDGIAAIKGGTINLKAGHNLLSVNQTDAADYADLENIAMSGVTVKAQGGDDTLLAHGSVEKGSIELGAGNNRIEIDHLVAKDSNDGANDTLWETKITTTSGDDTIILTGGHVLANASSDTSVMHSSTIDAGEGNNIVRIDGSGTDIRYGKGATYGMGSEENDSASNWGATNTVKTGKEATLKTGAGNDHITITADEDDGTAVYRASITDTGGNNFVDISGGTGLVLGSLSLGKGNDTLFLSGTAAYEAPTIDHSAPTGVGKLLATGAMDEPLGMKMPDKTTEVMVSGATGAALEGSSVTIGGGDNNVTLDGSSFGMLGTVQGTVTMPGQGQPHTAKFAVHKAASLAIKGSGDNLVDIEGGYMGAYAAKITLGTGDNQVSISGGTEAPAFQEGAGMASSSLTIAEGLAANTGDNRISISAVSGAAAGEASYLTLGMYDSTLSIGGAVADIDIESDGVGAAYSKMTLNAKNTMLDVKAGETGLFATTVNASGLLTANFSASGADTSAVIGDSNITATGSAQINITAASARGIAGGTLTFKNGSNALCNDASNILNIEAGNHGLVDATITSTSTTANDEISITSASGYAVDDSAITLSGGYNLLELQTKVANGVAVNKSTITLGAGNDSLFVGGGLSDSTIKTGGGDDFVRLGGGIDNSTLNLGDGNDTLHIRGASAAISNTTLTGGAGTDVLRLEGARDLAIIFDNSKAQGFEIINLIDTGASLAISHQGLTNFSGITAIGGKDILRITGDNDNTVSFQAVEVINEKEYTWQATSQLYRYEGQNYYLYQLLDADGKAPKTSGTTKEANLWETQVFVAANLANSSGSSLPVIPQGGDVNLDAIDASVYFIYGSKATSVAYSNLRGAAPALTEAGLEFGNEGDTVSITLDNSSTLAIDKGYLSLGNGSNMLEITGNGRENLTGVKDAAILAGSGNDTLRVSAVETALENCIVDLGDGKNLVEITGSDSLTLNTGKGDDTLTVTGDLTNSVVDLGDGLNLVSVNGNLEHSVLALGDKSDTVSLYGDMTGGVVNLGNGNNDFHARDLSAGASIYAGNGNDTIQANVITGGGAQDAVIQAGDGNNVIIVSEVKAEGQIRAGSDNDALNLHHLHSQADIDLGAGNDTLYIHLQNANNGQEFLGENTISAGLGQDVLDLSVASRSGVLSLSEVIGFDDNGLLQSSFTGFEVLNLKDSARGALCVTANDLAKFTDMDSLPGNVTKDIKAASGSKAETDALKAAIGQADVLRIDGDNGQDKLYLLPSEAGKTWSVIGNTGTAATAYTIYEYDNGARYLMVQNGVEVDLRKPPQSQLSASSLSMDSEDIVLQVSGLTAISNEQAAGVSIVANGGNWLEYSGTRICQVTVDAGAGTLTFSNFTQGANSVAYPFNLTLEAGDPYELGLNFTAGIGKTDNYVQLENMEDGNVYYGTAVDGKYFVNGTGGADEMHFKGLAAGSVINLGGGEDILDIQGVVGKGVTITGGNGSNSVHMASAESATISLIGAQSNRVTADEFMGKTKITMSGSENTLQVSSELNGLTYSAGKVIGSATVDINGDKHDITLGRVTGTSITSVTHDAAQTNSTDIIYGMGNSKLKLTGGKQEVKIGGDTYNSSITTGDADDTVNLELAINSNINLGGGNNKLTVRGLHDGKIDAGADSSNTLIIGDPDAAVQNFFFANVTTSLGNGANEVTMHNTMLHGKLSMGSGNDILRHKALIEGATIELGNGENQAYLTHIRDSKITGGNDADLINGESAFKTTFNLGTGGGDNVTFGSFEKVTLTSTSKAGEATNTLTVNAVSASTLTMGEAAADMNFGAMSGGSVKSGVGDDTFKLTGLGNSIDVALGTGANKVIIEGAMNGGKIVATDGNDTLQATGLLNRAAISLGDGQNEIEVAVMNGGSITTTKGDDKFTSSGHIGNAKIDLGAGANQITLGAGFTNSSLSTSTGGDKLTVNGIVQGSSLALGDGANTVTLNDGMVGGSLSVGKDNDEITVGGLVSGVTVTLGAGNNIFDAREQNIIGGSLTALAGDDVVKAESVYSGNINLGAGKNSFEFQNLYGTTLKSTGNESSLILNTGGKLHNSLVDFSGNSNQIFSDLGSEIGASTINLGGIATSVNTVAVGDILHSQITQKTGNLTLEAASLSGGQITAGAGNDTVSFGKAGAEVSAAVVSKGAVIDLGAGNNSFILRDPSEQSTRQSAEDATFKAAGGNDSFSAHNVSRSLLSLGAGDNTVSVNAFNNSTLSVGANDDRVTADSIDMSTLDLGAGNNQLMVTNAVKASSVISGNGKDTVFIGSAENAAFNLGDGNNTFQSAPSSSFKKSELLTGSGDDSVFLDDVTSGLVATGAGSDSIRLNGAITASSHIDAGLGNDLLSLGTDFQLEKGSRLDGGGGTDVMVLQAAYAGTALKTALAGQVAGVEILQIGKGLAEIGRLEMDVETLARFSPDAISSAKVISGDLTDVKDQSILRVTGNIGDVFRFVDGNGELDKGWTIAFGWNASGQQSEAVYTIDGKDYHLWHNESSGRQLLLETTVTVEGGTYIYGAPEPVSETSNYNDVLIVDGIENASLSISTLAGNDTINLLDSNLVLHSSIDAGLGDDLFVVGNGFKLEEFSQLYGNVGTDTLWLTEDGRALSDIFQDSSGAYGIEVLELGDSDNGIRSDLSSISIGRFLAMDEIDGAKALVGGKASDVNGNQILRIDGNADDAIRFVQDGTDDIDSSWQRAGNTEQANLYEIDGKAYTLWNDGNGTQALVQSGVTVTGYDAGSDEPLTQDWQGSCGNDSFILTNNGLDNSLLGGGGNDVLTLGFNGVGNISNDSLFGESGTHKGLLASSSWETLLVDLGSADGNDELVLTTEMLANLASVFYRAESGSDRTLAISGHADDKVTMTAEDLLNNGFRQMEADEYTPTHSQTDYTGYVNENATSGDANYLLFIANNLLD